MFKPIKDRRGFTLLELMIVIAILGILVTMAQPMYKSAGMKAREAALRENLFNLRSCLDQYYADNGAYPASLNDLVDKGYMRGVPVDPMTGNADWNTVFYSGGEKGEDAGGIFDVHSFSDKPGINGVPYSEW